ncbi:ribonuclease H-like domain-containing protein [Obelidium mucronatum]|nr:ribonuclease H-like domain-containing protein [Obelidium mucronatum]
MFSTASLLFRFPQVRLYSKKPQWADSKFPSRAADTLTSKFTSSIPKIKTRPHSSPQRQSNARQKRFVETFNALRIALEEALTKKSLKKSRFDSLDAAALEKLSNKQKCVNQHYLPIVTEKGLLTSEVASLVKLNGDSKPYWSTRHGSGLPSYISFFPSLFKVNKGGEPLLNLKKLNGEPVIDGDRLTFKSFPIPSESVNVSHVYSEYQRSGFDPPLPIASELPFDLIPCFLPRGYEIVYGTSPEICDEFVKTQIVDHVRPDGTWIPKPHTILGFDTETTVIMFSKNASTPNLIQIATPRKCLLVHQSTVQPPLPQSIQWVLSHPDIKKVCAEAAGERKTIRKFGIKSEGIVEIAERSQGKTQRGLATLAAMYLGLKVSKPKDLQVGDWTRPLNERQKNYAATDAWAILYTQDLPKRLMGGIDETRLAQWWEDEIVRRVALVDGYHDPKWGRLFLEAGMQKIRGTECGVTVFAERASKRVPQNLLQEFYASIQ